MKKKLKNIIDNLKPGFNKLNDSAFSVARKKVAIVGNPNVGKSVLFNNLTKKYVIVSNYPGTTVEVSRGIAKFDNEEFEIIDTPGMYSFSPLTEEERVARSIIFNETPKIILHVVDAKNIDRMLPLTIELKEAGLNMILVLNMMDEADKAGMEINSALLEKELVVPVVETVSVDGKGIDALIRRIVEYGHN